MARSVQEARPVEDLLQAAPLPNGGLEEPHSTATAASSACPDASERKTKRLKLGDRQLGHTRESAATKRPSPAKSTLPTRIPFDHRLAARLAAARSAESRQIKPSRILMKTKYGRMGEMSAVSKLQIELRSSKESNDALTAEVNTLRQQVGAQEAELASSSSLIAQLRRQVLPRCRPSCRKGQSRGGGSWWRPTEQRHCRTSASCGTADCRRSPRQRMPKSTRRY